MNRVSVLIVDDHNIVRQGLINLLSDEEWITVIGEASDGREAIQKVIDLAPDIVVIDIGMPELNGIEATRQILSKIKCKVIALTIHNNIQYVQEMLKSGASGYLLKDCAVDELIEAIKSVSENQYYISKTIVEQSLINVTTSSTVPLMDSETLSAREREVLQLIAEGNSTKIIADKLFLSPKTVETHRKNIMEKLQLFTVSELTKYALKNGITQLD